MVPTLISGFFIAMSVIGFTAMGIDKGRARKGAWRVSEKSLFLLSLLGGSPGTVMGMAFFRHKTRHWYFKYGLPAILVLQIALGVWLIR